MTKEPLPRAVTAPCSLSRIKLCGQQGFLTTVHWYTTKGLGLGRCGRSKAAGDKDSPGTAPGEQWDVGSFQKDIPWCGLVLFFSYNQVFAFLLHFCFSRWAWIHTKHYTFPTWQLPATLLYPWRVWWTLLQNTEKLAALEFNTVTISVQVPYDYRRIHLMVSYSCSEVVLIERQKNLIFLKSKWKMLWSNWWSYAREDELLPKVQLN